MKGTNQMFIQRFIIVLSDVKYALLFKHILILLCSIHIKGKAVYQEPNSINKGKKKKIGDMISSHIPFLLIHTFYHVCLTIAEYQLNN
jgi:hypothetical protein